MHAKGEEKGPTVAVCLRRVEDGRKGVKLLGSGEEKRRGEKGLSSLCDIIFPETRRREKAGKGWGVIAKGVRRKGGGEEKGEAICALLTRMVEQRKTD